MTTTENDSPAGAAQTTALVQRTDVSVVARDQFDPRQVGLLRALSRDAPDTEFNQFLELAARYQLDPFLRQIWLAQMGAGGWTVMVGRDGLLSKAHGDPDFLGIECGPHYSAYKFSVKYVRNERGEKEPDVTCEEKWVDAKDDAGKTIMEGGLPKKTRGALLGAWAIVRRRGRTPTYWYAEYAQYLPRSQAKREKSPWAQYDDGMIVKCAQSVALRLAYSISGVVVQEEVSQDPKFLNGTTTQDGEPTVTEIEWGADDTVSAKLAAYFRVLNELTPGAWLPKKIQLELKGKSDAARAALVERLEADIAAAGGVVPEVEVIEEAVFEPIDEEGFEVVEPLSEQGDLGLDGVTGVD